MYISTAQGHEHLWHEAEKLNHDHLDLLIDATRLDYPLVEELASLADGPQLAKLFDNTPEAAICRFRPAAAPDRAAATLAEELYQHR
ncbi:hypothetical protein [Pseudomonas protegens]|uniref:hypothetical protein n=1 Tax=Pseudomonas protegens TaxID=380021 RepID=UPI001FF080B0|nr:hypothetical protein [Pseudomonas protegens]